MTRMIMCGSALTTMSQLLAGSAPSRGRARLELVMRPFGFRVAAGFWGVGHDPDLAFRLHALLGGTPAYKDMCGGSGPGSLAEQGITAAPRSPRRSAAPSSALAHLLTGLQDIGLMERMDDALRGKLSVFRITEPIVRLHQLITGRYEPELVAGRADRVWERSADTVAAQIYGPHFEDLARRWCLEHAAEETLGARLR